MERQEPQFVLTVPDYSVRIDSLDGNTLGSGTLLIRKSTQTAWLMTCVHIFFPKEHSPLNKVRASFHKRESSQILTISDEDNSVMAGTCNKGNCYHEDDRGSCKNDYLCLLLTWEDWMNELKDTQLGKPMERGYYLGYGFCQGCNGSSACKSGKDLSATVSNLNSDFFSFDYSGNYLKSPDEQLAGYSGTGLFSASGELVGMVVGRYADEREYIAVAFRTEALEQRWNQGFVAALEEVCMVRRLHDPFGCGSILSSMRLELNLFVFLLGITGGVCIFLLDKKEGSLRQYLSSDHLNALIPNRVWRNEPISQAKNRAVPKNAEWSMCNGVVLSMEDTNNDWLYAAEWASRYFSIDASWRNGLLLFHVVSDGQALNLRKVMDQIPQRVVVQKPFYLLATDEFIRTVCEADLSESDEGIVAQACQTASEQMDPYAFLLDEAACRPALLPRLAERCVTSEFNEGMRTAGFRLAILYSALTGAPRAHSLFLQQEDKDFLFEVVWRWLGYSERLDLLDAILEERLVGQMESIYAYMEDGMANDSAILFGFASYEARSAENLEELISQPPSPLLLRALVHVLNRRSVDPVQTRQAIESLWNTSQHISLYCQFILCCRWGTREICQRIQKPDAISEYLSLMLDPEPDMSASAWNLANSSRTDLFNVNI